MFHCRSVDFKTISVPFTRTRSKFFFVLQLWRHGIEWDCDVIADVDNCLVLSYFLIHFTFHLIKGLRVVPRHSGYQKHLGLCLCYVPSLHSSTAGAGSPTKAQPCVPHNAWATILNPFNIFQNGIICHDLKYTFCWSFRFCQSVW